MGFQYTGSRNTPTVPAAYPVSGFGSSGGKMRVIPRRVLQSHERHVR